jgi:hypothetical protein
MQLTTKIVMREDLLTLHKCKWNRLVLMMSEFTRHKIVDLEAGSEGMAGPIT